MHNLSHNAKLSPPDISSTSTRSGQCSLRCPLLALMVLGSLEQCLPSSIILAGYLLLMQDGSCEGAAGSAELGDCCYYCQD